MVEVLGVIELGDLLAKRIISKLSVSAIVDVLGCQPVENLAKGFEETNGVFQKKKEVFVLVIFCKSFVEVSLVNVTITLGVTTIEGVLQRSLHSLMVLCEEVSDYMCVQSL